MESTYLGEQDLHKIPVLMPWGGVSEISPMFSMHYLSLVIKFQVTYEWMNKQTLADSKEMLFKIKCHFCTRY